MAGGNDTMQFEQGKSAMPAVVGPVVVLYAIIPFDYPFL
jgi:hypothetical protein